MFTIFVSFSMFFLSWILYLSEDSHLVLKMLYLILANIFFFFDPLWGKSKRENHWSVEILEQVSFFQNTILSDTSVPFLES